MKKTSWNTDKNGNLIDYSKYECPYAHCEKEEGHELHFSLENNESGLPRLWCSCGFRSPVCYTDPEILRLKLKPVILGSTHRVLNSDNQEQYVTVGKQYSAMGVCGITDGVEVSGTLKEVKPNGSGAIIEDKRSTPCLVNHRTLKEI